MTAAAEPEDADFLAAQTMMPARRAALAVDNARLYQQAQQALGARDDFLATAAHDLKNPLTALRGQSQLLQRRIRNQTSGSESAWLLDGLRSIEETTGRMSRQINALVDVVRL
ncbi:MAG: hypothetical protein NTZ05_08095 [Chloroflexi bacterium]|nr:hypothetical protein [Chloroflexota bacterium]